MIFLFTIHPVKHIGLLKYIMSASYDVPDAIKQTLYGLIDKIDTIGVGKNVWIKINDEDHPVRMTIGKQKDSENTSTVNWVTFCILFPTIQKIPDPMYKQATRFHSCEIPNLHNMILITIVRYATGNSQIRYWNKQYPNDCYGYCKTDVECFAKPDCEFTTDIIAKILELVAAAVYAQSIEFSADKKLLN